MVNQMSQDVCQTCGASINTAWSYCLTCRTKIEAAQSDLTDSSVNKTVNFTNVSWAPDGHQIVFSSQPVGSNSLTPGGNIYVMDADGQNLRQLTQHLASGWAPSWSPDGRQIAFTSDQDGSPAIYVMGTQGHDIRRLSDPTALDSDPAWSPDSKRIAFTRDRVGHMDLFAMDKDGKNVSRLTESPSKDCQPAWSPDGTQISFASGTGFNINICITDPSGDVRPLTDISGASNYPSWSPDGKEITFVGDHLGDIGPAIYVMNSDGTNVRQLKDCLGIIKDGYPNWSPDGHHIAFVSNRSGKSNIFTMDTDGGNVQQITGQ